jgi:hypothetical protein
LFSISVYISGRVGRMVAVGGIPVYRGWFSPGRNSPRGYPIPKRHSFPHATVPEDGDHSFRVARAESEFFDRVADGAFSGCIMRYPLIYGPRQIVPLEWSIVRRVMDSRRVFVMPDSGLALFSRGYALNVAHAVLLAVDKPDVVHGRGFDCADEDCFSWAQVVEAMAGALDVEVEILTTPFLPGHPGSAMVGSRNDHRVIDTSVLREELGYRDLVPTGEALAVTARWYRDHPLERDGELERTLQDAFDYVVEDKMIERTRQSHEELEALLGTPTQFTYAYDEKAVSIPYDAANG